MPIHKEEFENGRLSHILEQEIVNFLNEREEAGFTSEEIMGGVHFYTDFDTPETTKLSTFAVADFIALLYDLMREGKIRMKVVSNRMYFMAGKSAKCPKCEIEIAAPRKTWKMTGRPDRAGTRTELTIGLYSCPKHGAFRVALNKRKIIQSNKK